MTIVEKLKLSFEMLGGVAKLNDIYKVFKKIDKDTTKNSTKIIRNHIKFKNLIISDDLSMKSLKYSIEENTIKAFKAGCNLVLHCNGNLKEMNIVAINSPKIDLFIQKKTSEFYKILS